MFYQTDFSTEVLSTDLGTSEVWDYAIGSDELLAFVLSNVNGVNLSRTAVKQTEPGECLAGYVIVPETPHQRVESVVQTDRSGEPVWTGVFARFLDINNCVILRYDHLNEEAELIERVGGTDTVLKTLAPTRAIGQGVGLRLEVVGRRARAWFEPLFRKPRDEPPHVAANLSPTLAAPSASGQWGIYFRVDSEKLVSSGASSGDTEDASARIRYWAAADLPDTAPPAPTLRVRDASANASSPYRSGLRLSPATLTLNQTVGGIAPEVEVVATPLDAGDVPEGQVLVVAREYRSGQKLFLRPGLDYLVRAREVAADGSIGPWTEAETTAELDGTSGAAGNDATDDGLPFDAPNESWPDVTPDRVIPEEIESFAASNVAQTGRERFVAGAPATRSAWKLEFRSRPQDQILPVLRLWDRVRASGDPFLWVHPITGRRHVVRFAGDAHGMSHPFGGPPRDVDTGEAEAGNVTPTVDLSISLIECPYEANPATPGNFAGDPNLLIGD